MSAASGVEARSGVVPPIVASAVDGPAAIAVVESE